MGNLFLLKREIVCDRIALQKVPMTGWLPPNLYFQKSGEYIREEEMQMTDYEIIMIFLGIIGLPISSCGLLIALISFLDKRDKK